MKPLRGVQAAFETIEQHATDVLPVLDRIAKQADVLAGRDREIPRSQGHEVAASDVWAWAEPYDIEVVNEVVHAVVKLSPVDKSKLTDEAALMLTSLNELQGDGIYHIMSQFVAVDVPEPEWTKINSIEVDRNRLERALSHKSAWLMITAANLIEALGYMTSDRVATLLKKEKGYALAAAAHFASKLGIQAATDLLIARLQGPVVPGLEYLFTTLKDLGPPWNDPLADGIKAGLLTSSSKVAQEAANLALMYVEKGSPVPVKMLESAFEYWLVNEEPYPDKGGIIPRSPRETLLKALLLCDVIIDDRLIQLSKDVRSDVRGVADRALIERATTSSNTRAAFISATLGGKLSASLLARILSAKTALTPSEVKRLRPFLDDSDPKWRLAASKLLDPIYCDKDKICQEARKLANDSELEIREAAQRILTNICKPSN